MVTFKQFLSEQETNDLAEIIIRDCKPYLDQAKTVSEFLTRGMKEPRGQLHDVYLSTDDEDEESGKNTVDAHYFDMIPRVDRKPSASSDEMHGYYDEWFKDNFGWKARSEGVFCFPSHGISLYGPRYLIFPVGTFKYIWSSKVGDLYAYMPHRASREKVVELLEKGEYRDKGLSDALWGRSDTELMLKCDRYYAVPVGFRDRLAQALKERLGHD